MKPIWTVLSTFAWLSVFATPKFAQAQTYTCPSTSAKAASLRATAVDYQTSSDYAVLRSELPISDTDTSHVSLVSADSVCNAVTRAIKAVNAKSTAAKSTSLIVVRFGSLFAACVDDALPIAAVYILDDHYIVLTVMLGT